MPAKRLNPSMQEQGMKALRIHKFGDIGVMQIETIDAPRPQPGELLVRVQAASVNPVDHKTFEGKYPMVGRDKLPITLGRDVSGIVEQAEGALGWKPGDAIFAMLAPDRGAFAEQVIVKGPEAAPKPKRLSHAQAAAVPLASLTAWQGLLRHGGLAPGQRVLIHGGAGGVGHFAVQIAKIRGATVYTTVSERDTDFVRHLGADHAIDYKSQRFEDEVRQVDIVFDLVGGETQERSWSVLKPGGVLVSTLGQPPQETAAQHGARGVAFMAEPRGSDLAEIGRLIDVGQIRPVVAATFPFNAAREAERRLEEQHVRGKLVLEVAA
jgi:NADPH:quinone reductase-like Zn-dependent oxidoreductase